MVWQVAGSGVLAGRRVGGHDCRPVRRSRSYSPLYRSRPGPPRLRRHARTPGLAHPLYKARSRWRDSSMHGAGLRTGQESRRDGALAGAVPEWSLKGREGCGSDRPPSRPSISPIRKEPPGAGPSSGLAHVGRSRFPPLPPGFCPPRTVPPVPLGTTRQNVAKDPARSRFPGTAPPRSIGTGPEAACRTASQTRPGSWRGRHDAPAEADVRIMVGVEGSELFRTDPTVPDRRG